MAEDNKPYYKSSKAEEYLNYLVGSADDYPHDAPASRMEEYLQYLCAHKGEGGGGGVEPLIVYTDGTMQTSSLPAIVVPKITKEQLDKIHTAVSQGKLVLISDGNGHYTVTEIDETYDGVRLIYANAYLDYYLEGENVVCEHVVVGNQKICIHNVTIYNATITCTLNIISKNPVPFTYETLYTYLKTLGLTSYNNAYNTAGTLKNPSGNLKSTYGLYANSDGTIHALSTLSVSGGVEYATQTVLTGGFKDTVEQII